MRLQVGGSSTQMSPVCLTAKPSVLPTMFQSGFTIHILQAAGPAGQQHVRNLQVLTPFWQPQRQQFCLVHSVNALLGYSGLTPEAVVSYLDDVKTRYLMIHQQYAQPQTPDTTSWQHYYTPGGNFTVACLNKYIAHKKVFGAALTLQCSMRPCRLSMDAVTACITESAWKTGGIFVSDVRGYAHASAIVRFNGDWWLVDSECAGPTVLSESELPKLRGSLYTLKHLQEHHKTSVWKFWCPDDPCPEEYYRTHSVSEHGDAMTIDLTGTPSRSTAPSISTRTKQQHTNLYRNSHLSVQAARLKPIPKNQHHKSMFDFIRKKTRPPREPTNGEKSSGPGTCPEHSSSQHVRSPRAPPEHYLT